MDKARQENLMNEIAFLAKFVQKRDTANVKNRISMHNSIIIKNKLKNNLLKKYHQRKKSAYSPPSSKFNKWTNSSIIAGKKNNRNEKYKFVNMNNPKKVLSLQNPSSSSAAAASATIKTNSNSFNNDKNNDIKIKTDSNSNCDIKDKDRDSQSNTNKKEEMAINDKEEESNLIKNLRYYEVKSEQSPKNTLVPRRLPKDLYIPSSTSNDNNDSKEVNSIKISSSLLPLNFDMRTLTQKSNFLKESDTKNDSIISTKKESNNDNNNKVKEFSNDLNLVNKSAFSQNRTTQDKKDEESTKMEFSQKRERLMSKVSNFRNRLIITEEQNNETNNYNNDISH